MTTQGQPDPPPQAGQGQGQAQGQQEPPPATTGQAFNELVSKKGFKSPDDVAKSYQEMESMYSKNKQAWEQNRKLLEAEGVQFDENGNIVVPSSPGSGQPNYQAPPQQGQPDIFGQINQQFLDDPARATLALFGAAIQDYESKSGQARKVGEDFFKQNADAGEFRSDVEALVQSQPVQQRVRAETWQNALLVAKGKRYNDAIRITKEETLKSLNQSGSIQSVQGGGSAQGAQGGPSLTQEQEKTFQWYEKNKPGRFKDKAEFLKYMSPNLGR